MEIAVARPANKLLPSLGFLLAAGGLLLIAWVAWSTLKPRPAPYHYQLVQEDTPAGFDTADVKAWPNLKIEKYEMRVDGVANPVAVMHLARRGNGAAVMIDWDNLTDQPVASLDVSFPELTAVAKAIDKHTGKNALVLGWWDTSREIRLLTGRDAVFDAHMGQPFILPSFWGSQSGSIEGYESKFWGAQPSAEQQAKFERFANALTESVAKGVASLHDLVGGREAYVAVNVSDIYKLALMRPDRLSVASRVFPLNANIHGDINTVDQWERERRYSAYGLQKLPQNRVRAYFLADAKSGQTLLAQMLPFTSSNPPALRGIQLVYQHGEYWVYRLPAVKSSH